MVIQKDRKVKKSFFGIFKTVALSTSLTFLICRLFDLKRLLSTLDFTQIENSQVPSRKHCNKCETCSNAVAARQITSSCTFEHSLGTPWIHTILLGITRPMPYKCQSPQSISFAECKRCVSFQSKRKIDLLSCCSCRSEQFAIGSANEPSARTA